MIRALFHINVIVYLTLITSPQVAIVKKTSLVILIALALVSGASAYAFTEGVFDDVIDLIEQDEEVSRRYHSRRTSHY